MGMDFRFHHAADTRHTAIRLSGRVVGQLGLPEQLVIWALRESLSTAEPGSAERFARGLRFAFGPRLTGPAACSFDGLRRCLLADPRRAPRFCPLRCACLSADEDAVLDGLAASQIGDRTRHDSAMHRFVAPPRLLQLWRQSRILTQILRHADLELTDRRLVTLAAAGAAN